ncbi:MAG: hypothetical protein IIZ48_06925 [Erysipelotrichales bacterium]|nr:hypothetical protein [Erysipelotrichales bacterium]
MNKKKFTVVALVLALFAVVVSGTLAYFTDETNDVKNQFETAELHIDLWENDAEYNSKTAEWEKAETELHAGSVSEGVTEEAVGVEYTDILPGMVLPKNPTVTVKADSVECWVLVKVTTEKKTAKALYDALKAHEVPVTGQNDDSAYAAAAALTDFDAGKWELLKWKVGEENVDFVIGYKEKVAKSEDDQDLVVFTTINVPAEWENEEMAALNEATLTFRAYAIQAYKVDDLDAANTALNPLGE